LDTDAPCTTAGSPPSPARFSAVSPGSWMYVASDSKPLAPARTSSRSAGLKGPPSAAFSGCTWCRRTSWPASLYGRGRSSTPFTTLKMAVFSPMPRARVSTATSVKPGVRRSVRSA
jgi:hypothetical protein